MTHPLLRWFGVRVPSGAPGPDPFLVVERLPADAQELNPVEGMWSNLKVVEVANPTRPTPAEVIDQAHRGIGRVRRTSHLAYSVLRPRRAVGHMNR